MPPVRRAGLRPPASRESSASNKAKQVAPLPDIRTNWRPAGARKPVEHRPNLGDKASCCLLPGRCDPPASRRAAHDRHRPRRAKTSRVERAVPGLTSSTGIPADHMVIEQAECIARPIAPGGHAEQACGHVRAKLGGDRRRMSRIDLPQPGQAAEAPRPRRPSRRRFPRRPAGSWSAEGSRPCRCPPGSAARARPQHQIVVVVRQALQRMAR